MALKLYIAVLAERHNDDQVELFPNEVAAMDRAKEWLRHWAPKAVPTWTQNLDDKAWLHHGYISEQDDGPSARIVEVLLDLGLFSDREAETMVKVLAGARRLCPTCDGVGVYPYAPQTVCEECRGLGSQARR